MGVWQVAAGSIGTDYTDHFLDMVWRSFDHVQLGAKVILKRGLSQSR